MKKEKSTKGIKERKPNWKEVYASVDDIKAFLSDRVLLRRNVVTNRVEIHWLTDFGDPPPEADAWHDVTDWDTNTLWTLMAQEKPVREQDMQRVINSEYTLSLIHI